MFHLRQIRLPHNNKEQMNENLIQVLWVEDDPQITLTYPLEAAKYGIQLVPYSCWEEAEKALKFALWNKGLTHFVKKSDLGDLKDALVWYLRRKNTPHWLRTGLREQSVVASTGEILRYDLLVPGEKYWLVIDYKSGDPHESYIKKIRGYLYLLEQNVKKAVGVIVYLKERKFQGVTSSDLTELQSECPDLDSLRIN